MAGCGTGAGTKIQLSLACLRLHATIASRLRLHATGTGTTRTGPIQRYLCKSCDQTFSGRPGFKKRHAGPEAISRALREAAYGLSCVAVQAVMAQDGTTVHSSTIYRWTAHYSALMDEYSRRLQPRTGYKWHCDEIHSRFARRRGGFLPSWTAPAGSYCPMTCLLQNSTTDPPPCLQPQGILPEPPRGCW